jgi:hypothetical protein
VCPYSQPLSLWFSDWYGVLATFFLVCLPMVILLISTSWGRELVCVQTSSHCLKELCQIKEVREIHLLQFYRYFYGNWSCLLMASQPG